jgi:DnaJ-class molecular chaperone
MERDQPIVIEYRKADGRGPFSTSEAISKDGQRAQMYRSIFCPDCKGQCVVSQDLECEQCRGRGVVALHVPMD